MNQLRISLARLHFAGLRYAIGSAYLVETAKRLDGRPECTQRAAWVVQFDRAMDQSR